MSSKHEASRTAPTATTPAAGINDGRRVVLVAASGNTTSPILAMWFHEPGATGAYAVPAGFRLILTGLSGSGGTVLGDYWQVGAIGCSGVGGDSTFFRFVPTPATPPEIGSAGGNFSYWTLTAPLSVAVNAGERLNFTLTHRAVNDSGVPLEANFTAYLTGYLVAVA